MSHELGTSATIVNPMSDAESNRPRTIRGAALAPILFALGVGVAMVSSVKPEWWGLGSILISGALVAAVVVWVVLWRRGQRTPITAERSSTWTAGILASALGAVVGTLFFSGSTATLALVPVLLVFAGAISARYVDSSLPRIVGFSAAMGVSSIVIIWGTDPAAGFGMLVQGSVVGLAAAAVLALIAAIAKRLSRSNSSRHRRSRPTA